MSTQKVNSKGSRKKEKTTKQNSVIQSVCTKGDKIIDFDPQKKSSGGPIGKKSDLRRLKQRRLSGVPVPREICPKY